ncbi:MAG: dicarboxylate/amino acid:cation symporter, partial [Bacteroidota bacterium]|nr:dicarboxylate/amino acid:cation symporter [Bacteroidota bacterium]
MNHFLKRYANILLLLGGVVLGSVLGIVFGAKINFLKPVGDIFLNLLFTAVVPLVFFTISTSIATVDRSQKFGKLMGVIMLCFLLTVVVAGIITLVGVSLFPIGEIKTNVLFTVPQNQNISLGDQITSMLTADDVYKIFSRRNMLALIILSALTGFAVLRSGKEGEVFVKFLKGGSAVFTQILGLIMKGAPIG